MRVRVNVRERIAKPVHEVFEAFIQPEKMANYFISGATMPMRAGARIEWSFADVGATVAVDVVEVDDDRRITFDWNATGVTTRVKIDFSEGDPGMTVVAIEEQDFPLDDEGVKRALGQNAGWTYTLCCLKAYLQHGIHLRAGLDKKLTDVASDP